MQIRRYTFTLKLQPIVLVLVVGLVAVSSVGCSSGSNAAKQKQTSHLRTLVSLFNSSSRSQGGAPKSEEEFRKYIEANGLPVLERLEIPSVDDLLLSERDDQPFVVFYGPKKPRGVRPDVVAYEQVGIEGVRQVGFSLGMIEDVDETQFRELVPESVQTQ